VLPKRSIEATVSVTSLTASSGAGGAAINLQHAWAASWPYEGQPAPTAAAGPPPPPPYNFQATVDSLSGGPVSVPPLSASAFAATAGRRDALGRRKSCGEGEAEEDPWRSVGGEAGDVEQRVVRDASPAAC
jgi:hypothetical protein